MMLKKVIASVALVATVAVSAAMFAAFEAHVINVTAKIENALHVPIDHIDFGTVFPQEELDRYLDIKLSQSFMDEDRVDDIEYIIRQKPKCAITWNNGKEFDPASTMTGHLIIDANGNITVDCGEEPTLTSEQSWEVLPSLCPYLSKHKSMNDPDTDQTEVQVGAFHQPYEAFENPDGTWKIVYTEAKGRLAKSDDDFEDNWIIDLKVPCFGDHCAQDWEDFVTGINPDVVDPSLYVQPIGNEHKIFGCDLWVEVTEVSESNGDLACVDADVMLVLDRSGSVGTELATLKTAAKAFVTALNPEPDGVWMGQTSFATFGSLDLHLTSNVTAINGAIDSLVSVGYTNLAEGLTLATAELVNLDRTSDVDYPDYMVVITDGNPNRPTDEATARALAATAADTARAAGIKIYVVGVGADIDATYLSEEIANSTGQYYNAANYSELEDILEDIATCTP